MQIVPGSTGALFPEIDFEGTPVAFGGNLLSLLVTRSSFSRNFPYIITLIIPLIFCLIFFWILFLSKQGSGEPLPTTLYNILIGMLTVVSLRPILVPADLQGGVTYLDFWFGLWATAPLLLFFIKSVSLVVRKK